MKVIATKVKCVECAMFEDFSGDSAYCGSCLKQVAFRKDAESAWCEECGGEVFINKCVLLDIFNIMNAADKELCQYYQSLEEEEQDVLMGEFERFTDDGRPEIRLHTGRVMII